MIVNYTINAIDHMNVPPQYNRTVDACLRAKIDDYEGFVTLLRDAFQGVPSKCSVYGVVTTGKTWLVSKLNLLTDTPWIIASDVYPSEKGWVPSFKLLRGVQVPEVGLLGHLSYLILNCGGSDA